MNGLRVNPQLREKFARMIGAKCVRVADQATENVLTEIFRETPMEDGHTHASWKEAGKQAIGSSADRALLNSGVDHSRLSHDPIAVASGAGTAKNERLYAERRLVNRLDFVVTLEMGGIQRPISPGGRKIDPVRRPPNVGPLYGPRSSKGRGLLVWTDESGVIHKGVSRTVPAGRFVSRAIEKTRVLLNRKGGK